MKRWPALVLLGLAASVALSAEEPKPRATLGGDGPAICCMTFSADSKTLAWGSEDGTIRLWDAVAGTVTLTGQTTRVRCLAFSPDGKTLASGGDTTVRLWNVAAGKQTAALEDQAGPIVCMAFSPDGKTLAANSGEKAVKLLGPGDGQGETQPRRRHGGLSCLQPRWKVAGHGGLCNVIALWDVSTGNRTPFPGGGRQCPAPKVVFSPDGKALASGGMCQSTVTLSDVAACKSTASLTGLTPWGAATMVFTPDSKTVIAAGRRGEIKWWDTATGENTATFKMTADYIQAVALSPDSKTLAVTWREKVNTIQIWDVAQIKGGGQ